MVALETRVASSKIIVDKGIKSIVDKKKMERELKLNNELIINPYRAPQ